MTKCPKCGRNEYGPGPCYDQFRWIGCYACGYGFKDDKSPKFECQGKRQYASKDEALREIHRMMEESFGGEGGYLRHYKCKHCKYWHLTDTSK
jgi:hypothetical protein